MCAQRGSEHANAGVILLVLERSEDVDLKRKQTLPELPKK